MGFIKKARAFLGGHGVSVRFVRVERSEPENATFPVADPLLKSTIEIAFEEDAEVLSHTCTFVVEHKTPNGKVEQIILGKERHDQKSRISGSSDDFQYEWPYTKPGATTVRDAFFIDKIDIASKLKKLGYSDIQSAVDRLTFKLKVLVDVKGSPADPKTEVPVRVLG